MHAVKEGKGSRTSRDVARKSLITRVVPFNSTSCGRRAGIGVPEASTPHRSPFSFLFHRVNPLSSRTLWSIAKKYKYISLTKTPLSPPIPGHLRCTAPNGRPSITGEIKKEKSPTISHPSGWDEGVMNMQVGELLAFSALQIMLMELMDFQHGEFNPTRS
ncbi:uncharacterized protein [Elaeis guineensis]|uniref:uncharacterized protein n=1 Tax=Elaeis guineensis var. tenera TaxID=51953 RepID=UPI003C6CDEDC